MSGPSPCCRPRGLDRPGSEAAELPAAPLQIPSSARSGASYAAGQERPSFPPRRVQQAEPAEARAASLKCEEYTWGELSSKAQEIAGRYRSALNELKAVERGIAGQPAREEQARRSEREPFQYWVEFARSRCLIDRADFLRGYIAAAAAAASFAESGSFFADAVGRDPAGASRAAACCKEALRRHQAYEKMDARLDLMPREVCQAEGRSLFLLPTDKHERLIVDLVRPDGPGRKCFDGLPAVLKQRAISLIASRPPESAEEVFKIMHASAFSQFSEEQKQQLFNLLENTAEDAWNNIFGLLATTDLSTRQCILMDRDARTHTLLDNLSSLSSSTLADALQPQQERIIAELIAELDVYSKVSQDDHGVCPVSAIQKHYARKHPAELVRLASGLMSPAGAVFPANFKLERKVLAAAPNSLEPDTSCRTAVDRIVQAAWMDFADGEQWVYDNRRDEHVSAAGEVRRSGLIDEEVMRLLKSLSVREHQLFTKAQDGAGAIMAALEKGIALTQNGPRLNLAGLRWKDDPAGLKHGYHAVEVLWISKDRVHFYLSSGIFPDIEGREYGPPDHPQMRLENSWEGRFSMKRGEFEERVEWTINEMRSREAAEVRNRIKK